MPKKKQRGKIPDNYQIVGVSKYFDSLRRHIKKVAENDDHVLITGPTGTGKELVAFNIHWKRNHTEEKFKPVNCSAIPHALFDSEFFGMEKNVATGVASREGHIAAAKQGTLFLDEIGDIAIEDQAKLLRFLDNKTYMPIGKRTLIPTHVKVIAATNRDLPSEIEKGTFREDLYYRLARQIIRTEPLSGKMTDIICLINHFMKKNKVQNYKVKFLLYFYNFPGNVRQLSSLIQWPYDDIKTLIKSQSNDQYNTAAELMADIKYDDDEILRKILNYEFSDDKSKLLSQLRALDFPRQDQSIETEYQELLSEHKRANKKYMEKAIKWCVQTFELIYLAQETALSKTNIAEILNIRPDNVTNPETFKKRFLFAYPEGTIRYDVHSLPDVYPFPDLIEEDDDDT
jgi:transcriptional regulator with PAS, ATPase and Fis domain